MIGLDRILNQTQMRIFREFEMDLGLDRLFEQHVPEEDAQSFFFNCRHVTSPVLLLTQELRRPTCADETRG